MTYSRLDMDVEDNSLTNAAGIDRRNKAIHQVEQWARRTGRTVQFVYTIPTGPAGLEQAGIDVLANAVANDARIEIVNIMTFDYYDDQAHEMAADTKTAAASLVATLHSLYPHRSPNALWRMVGVTEMIGIDDYGSGGESGPLEIFSLADARDVTRWARTTTSRNCRSGPLAATTAAARRLRAVTTARALRRRIGNSLASWPVTPVAAETHQNETAALHPLTVDSAKRTAQLDGRQCPRIQRPGITLSVVLGEVSVRKPE